MPNETEKDGEASVPLSRREMLAASASLIVGPEASTGSETIPVGTVSAPAETLATAASAFVPDRWWERQGRHNPPPGSKMLTWATVDPDKRLELERFYFEMYCEVMCDATGDPEEDKPIDEMEAAWLRIRADNDAYFAQQQQVDPQR